MATLRSTLEQVKQQFHEFLSPTMILQVCQEHQYRFRQRVLGPHTTNYWEERLDGTPLAQHDRPR
ncbi:MAG: hypothetical protein NTZ17_02815 [Phycisphaerae bacterium]|nr:hypothetical protein [Phycisphaerae bacterium]